MRILRSRIHYWTCSKFANWIRGEDKPHALEWSKWTEWKNEQKKQRPFRYWLSDTFLRKLQNVVYFPSDVYYTIKTYVRNRFIDKTHYLKTNLPPGDYYDFDHRILHSLFNELVDFVELELSSLSRWNKDKNYKFVKGRCQEAQDDYFRWANHLKHQGRLTEQAKASRRIKELYEWWKYLRPQRADPYSSSEFSYDIGEILDGKKIKQKQKSYQKSYDLEEQYDNEDTEMLIELIKIRNHLWT
jgi:hypothetical protein